MFLNLLSGVFCQVGFAKLVSGEMGQKSISALWIIQHNYDSYLRRCLTKITTSRLKTTVSIRPHIQRILTYWGRDKMATVWQTAFCVFLNKIVLVSMKYHRICSQEFINNRTVLFPIITSRQSGEKQLSELTMVKFVDAYLGHSA